MGRSGLFRLFEASHTPLHSNFVLLSLPGFQVHSDPESHEDGEIRYDLSVWVVSVSCHVDPSDESELSSEQNEGCVVSEPNEIQADLLTHVILDVFERLSVGHGAEVEPRQLQFVQFFLFVE